MSYQTLLSSGKQLALGEPPDQLERNLQYKIQAPRTKKKKKKKKSQLACLIPAASFPPSSGGLLLSLFSRSWWPRELSVCHLQLERETQTCKSASASSHIRDERDEPKAQPSFVKIKCSNNNSEIGILNMNSLHSQFKTRFLLFSDWICVVPSASCTLVRAERIEFCVKLAVAIVAQALDDLFQQFWREFVS